MPKYWFMYDTGLSLVRDFDSDEYAAWSARMEGDRLMFYYKETDDAQ